MRDTCVVTFHREFVRRRVTGERRMVSMCEQILKNEEGRVKLDATVYRLICTHDEEQKSAAGTIIMIAADSSFRVSMSVLIL